MRRLKSSQAKVVIGLLLSLAFGGAARALQVAWNAWSLSPAQSTAPQPRIVPRWDGTLGDLSVDTFTGLLNYSVPLPTLPTRDGRTPELQLHSVPMAQEGLGSGWTFSVPSVSRSSDVAAGELRARKQHKPYKVGGLKGLELSGLRLVYKGPAAGTDLDALRLSSYRIATDGPVQTYGPEGSETAQRVWYFDSRFSFCDSACESGQPVSLSSGFIVQQSDGVIDVYSGEPGDAEGDFTSFADQGTMLPPFITRWPLVYRVFPGGDSIHYAYQKMDPEKTAGAASYLKYVEFAGGASRYDFRLCELGSEECPFLSYLPAFTAGYAHVQTALYTEVQASFKGAVRDRWCLLYHGPSKFDDTVSPVRGGSAHCRGLASGELRQDVDTPVPMLDQLIRVGAGPIPNETPPSLRFQYREPRLSAQNIQVQTLETLKEVRDWTQASILDLNNDGLPDYFDANQELHRNSGRPGSDFQPGAPVRLQRDGSEGTLDLRDGRMQIADMNGDSYADIVELLEGARPGIYVYAGKPDGHFAVGQLLSGAEVLQDLTALDLKQGTAQWLDVNGDGAADLVLFQNAGIRIAINQWSLSGGLDTRYGVYPIQAQAGKMRELLLKRSLRFQDMNGDDLPDLVLASENQPGFCIYLNTGIHQLYSRSLTEGQLVLFTDQDQLSQACDPQNRTFRALGPPQQNWVPSRFWFLDLSGDGLADILDLSDDQRTFQMWVNQGIRFAAPLHYSLPQSLLVDEKRSQVKIADLNGDGHLDMLVRDASDAVLQMDWSDGRPSRGPDDQRLLSILSDRGSFYKIQYTSSQTELQRDAAQDAIVRPYPDPLVKRVIRGFGSPDAMQASSVELLEYLYSEAIFHPRYGELAGYGRVQTLSLMDLDGEQSRPSTWTEELFEGMDPAAADARPWLIGKPSVTRVSALDLSPQQKSSWLQSVHDESLPEEHVSWLSPEQRHLIKSEAYTWAIYKDEGHFEGGTWTQNGIRLLERTHVDYAPGGRGPDLKEVTRSSDFDDFNIAHCESYERSGLEIQVEADARLPIPPKQVTTCSSFAGARSELQAWGILDKADLIVRTDELSGQLLAETQLSYHQASGQVRQTRDKVIVDLSHLPAAMKDAVDDKASERILSYEYDRFGNLIRIDENAGHRDEHPLLQKSFDETGTLLLSEKNAALHETLYCYAEICPGQVDPPLDFSFEHSAYRLTHLRSPQGVWTFLNYDPWGRLQKSQDSTGSVETYAYRSGSVDRPTYVLVESFDTEEKSPGRSEGEALLLAYDAANRPLFRLARKDQTGSYMIDFSRYNALGDLVENYPHLFLRGSDPKEVLAMDQGLSLRPDASLGEQVSYDAEGRVIRRRRLNGYERRTDYEPGLTTETESQGEGQEPKSVSQRLVVGLAAETVAFIDENKAITRLQRDHLGHVVEVFVPGHDEPRRFAFNNQDEMLLVHVPGVGTRVWQRNERGLPTECEILDSLGKPLHQLRSDFDSLGRTLAVRVDGKLVSQFQYDQASPSHDAPRPSGAVGQMVYAAQFEEDPRFSSQIQFAYDAQSRLSKKVTAIGPRHFEEQFAYTQQGSLRDVSSTDRETGSTARVRYQRGLHGRLEAVALGLPWKTGMEPFLTKVGYDEQGAVNALSYANGLQQEFAFDPWFGDFLEMKTKRLQGAQETVLQDSLFQRDTAGKLERIVDQRGTIAAGGGMNRSADFFYDASRKLTKALRYGHIYEYAYGPDQLLLRHGECQEHDDCAPPSSAEGQDGEAADTPNMRWNEQGQLVKFGGLDDARFDAFGRLVSIDKGEISIRFGYAADGRRLYKSVRQGRSESISYFPSEWMQADETGTQHMVFLGEHRLARIIGSRQDYVISIFDQVGSTELLVNSQGDPMTNFAYTAFGQAVSAEGQLAGAEDVPALSPYRFAGHYWDAETGLYLVGDRYYAPSLGLFISPDLSSLASSDWVGAWALAPNLYSYSRNDPVNLRESL